MSDCLLRVSEVVAVNVGDLKEKTLIVRVSKTDQEGIGEALDVTGDTRRIIKQYREQAGIVEVGKQEPMFRRLVWGDHIQQGRFSARSARRQIRYWTELAGVEGFISGHSLRGGSAVSLAQAGLRWWICRWRADGSLVRCRRIMPKQSWQSEGLSQDTGKNPINRDQGSVRQHLYLACIVRVI